MNLVFHFQMLEQDWERQLNDEQLLKSQLKRLQEDLRRVSRKAEKDLSKKCSLEEKIGQYMGCSTCGDMACPTCSDMGCPSDTAQTCRAVECSVVRSSYIIRVWFITLNCCSAKSITAVVVAGYVMWACLGV